MPVELTSIYSGGLTSHASNSESWRAASNVMNGGGSPPAPPPPPKPPDYASANRAGIMTDVATLSTRKSVENAALFGGKVKNYGVEERTDSSGKPYYVQLYDEDGKRLKEAKTISEQEAFQTFDDNNTTLAATEKLADWQRTQRDEEAQSIYDLGQKYGDKYITMAKDYMEKLDPEGTMNRKELATAVGRELERYGGTGPALTDITRAIEQEKIGNSPDMKNVDDAKSQLQIGKAQDMERVGNADKMEKVEGDGPSFQRGNMEQGGGATQGVRNNLEQRILEGLASGEGLTGSQSRAIERDLRSAQVARGNYNGPAASAAEIASKYDFGTRLGQQRRAEALGLLSSGQSSFDVADRLRQEGNQLSQKELENRLATIGQRNAASQSDLQNTLATTSQRNQASQIDYDNLMNQITQNNQANQQDFGNRMASTQFNNSNLQQMFANNLAAVGQRNSASQQDYSNQMGQAQFNNQNAQQRLANDMAIIGQRNAVQQQGIANRMSYAGLTPVGSIASTTAGAAALPIPNTPSAQLMQLLNVNPNAGNDAAKFALGVFDTQSRNYQSLLNYNASTYRTNQEFNSPLSWVTGVGGAASKMFSFGI